MRNNIYEKYKKYLGHQLTEQERNEIQARIEECKLNKLIAFRGCCLSIGGMFAHEITYLKSILDGEPLNVESQ